MAIQSLVTLVLSGALLLNLGHGADAAAVTFNLPAAPSDAIVTPIPGANLGARPVSVDAGGSTYYIGSNRNDPFTMTRADGDVLTYPSQTTTVPYTFRADASAYYQYIEGTKLAPGDTDGHIEVSCSTIPDSDGNIVCEKLLVFEDRPHTVVVDETSGETVTFSAAEGVTVTLTESGKPAAWLTVSNVETWDIPRATAALASGSGVAGGEGKADDDEKEDVDNDTSGARAVRAGLMLGIMVGGMFIIL